jgi:hypothetical protein
MHDDEIRNLVAAFHTKDDGTREAVWLRLREHGTRAMPFFAELFPNARWFEVRRDIAFHAIRFARTNAAAFEIGRMAVEDKSGIVRYRGCGIIAYSLRPDALPIPRQQIAHPDPKTVDDVEAAIDAISNGNHHYFVDRQHTGKTFWSVNDGSTTCRVTSRCRQGALGVSSTAFGAGSGAAATIDGCFACEAARARPHSSFCGERQSSWRRGRSQLPHLPVCIDPQASNPTPPQHRLPRPPAPPSPASRDSPFAARRRGS